MRLKKITIALAIICLFLDVNGCLAGSRKLKNGYTLPEATQENVDKLIRTALGNLVFVEGGSYMMGDGGYPADGGRAYWSPWLDNFPVHKVTLDSFSIFKYEVTWWQYDVFNDLKKNEPFQMIRAHKYYRRDNYPVGAVTWQQAQDYCLWLGEKTGLPFSLPTEAQWEYAARSRGQNVGYATDNGKMEDGRNHRKDGDYVELYPVGTFPPNPLGLYEMSGNVSEWVLDWYDKKYYEKSPELNPQGPKTGTKKVLRGGTPTSTPSGNDVYGRLKWQIVFTEKELKAIKQDLKETYGRDWLKLYSPGTIYYYGMRCVVNSPKPVKIKFQGK